MLFRTTILLLAFSWSPLFSQSENLLLDRTFWKSQPDLATVQAKVAEGHDPKAMTSAAFDGAIYAMLEQAPYEVIKYMLDQQDDPANKLTHDGRTYLMWAAYAGQKKATQYLIDLGSDLGWVDDHGYATIPFCATTGMMDPEIYDLLIDKGADIEATNRDGANAILLIAKHLGDDHSMIDYFQAKGLSMATTDYDGNGLFNYAAIMGNITLMEKAIEWKLPYKEPNAKGGNAMIFASQGYRGSVNDLDVYEFLAEQGVPANVVTNDGETPLHNIAFRTKNPAVYAFFIERGVDINQEDADGNTMFLNATRGGNTAIVWAYMDQVSDLNHTNKDGHSALTFAVRSNQPELIQKLIDAGAETAVIDKAGNNLLAHLFERYTTQKQDAFLQSLGLLITNKVDVHAAQADGNNLIHIAVDKGDVFLLDQAVALGVDINAKNENGLTPLHFAAMKAKDANLLTLLMQKGADASIKTDFEESVYDLAAENELLKGSGFNLDALKKE